MAMADTQTADGEMHLPTDQQIVEAANAFYAELYCVPYMDAELAALSADRLRFIKTALRGPADLLARIMETIDAASGAAVIEGGDVL